MKGNMLDGTFPFASSTSPQGVPMSSWSWVFSSHLYLFATAWFLVALYALVTLINLHSLVQFVTLSNAVRQLLSRVCTMLCFTAILRAAYLLVDPYEEKKRIPSCVSRAVYIVCAPGFLGVFVYVFVALLAVTGFRCGSRCKLPRRLMATFAVTFWYAAMVVSELLVCSPVNLSVCNVLMQAPHFDWLQTTVTACLQLTFVVFSFVVYLLFLHYGVKLIDFVTRNSTRDIGYRCCRISKFNQSAGSRMLAFNAAEILPKIRITDEHDCTVSYTSESRCTSTVSTISNDLGDGDDVNAAPGTKPSKVSLVNKLTNKLKTGREHGTRRAKRRHRQQQPPTHASPLAARKNDSTSSFSSATHSDRRKPCKTRVEKLHRLIRCTYWPAICGLVLCVWQFCECVSRLMLLPTSLAVDRDKADELHWAYVAFLIVYRLTELVLCTSVCYLVRHRFNVV